MLAELPERPKISFTPLLLIRESLGSVVDCSPELGGIPAYQKGILGGIFRFIPVNNAHKDDDTF